MPLGVDECRSDGRTAAPIDTDGRYPEGPDCTAAVLTGTGAHHGAFAALTGDDGEPPPWHGGAVPRGGSPPSDRALLRATIIQV